MPLQYFTDEINGASARYGVPTAVIKAVIMIESSWNPRAYRPEPTSAYCIPGSFGLMQLCPATAREMGWSGSNNQELYDPALNINLGTAYLKTQASRYGGNWIDAVAAYNAGSVRRTSTGAYVNQTHVNRFIQWWNSYKGQEGQAPTPPITTPYTPPYAAPTQPEKKTPIIPTEERPTLWGTIKSWLRRLAS